MQTGDTVDRFAQFDAMGIPVGGGVYFAAAQGVSKAVLELIESTLNLPPAVTGAAGSWAVNNVDIVRNFLGRVGSYDLAKVMLAQGVNSQFDLSGRIEALLNRAETVLPGLELESSGGGETSGFPSTPSVGQYPAPLEEQGVDADIYEEYMNQAEFSG